jgi:hypothetical protein
VIACDHDDAIDAVVRLAKNLTVNTARRHPDA